VKHKVYGKHLGRDKNRRSALFKSLVGALILHGSIVTTESKAKAIKGLVDKIISQAKSKNTQRLVAQFLINKDIQDKLFKDIVPSVKNRTSGYTSIIKLGNRPGDNAMKVKMSLLTEETAVAPKVAKVTAVEEVSEEKDVKKEVKPKATAKKVKKA
jgi:large subunit ribosomal protein L17